MAESAYIASFLVTGVVLLGVFLFVGRIENWRQYDRSSRESSGRSTDVFRSPEAWAVCFLLLAFVVGGGAVLLVSDASLGAAAADALGEAWVGLVAAFAVLLGAYLLWGTYQSARFRGLHSAQAVLVSAWLFGLLFVAAIAAKLVTGG